MEGLSPEALAALQCVMAEQGHKCDASNLAEVRSIFSKGEDKELSSGAESTASDDDGEAEDAAEKRRAAAIAYGEARQRRCWWDKCSHSIGVAEDLELYKIPLTRDGDSVNLVCAVKVHNQQQQAWDCSLVMMKYLEQASTIASPIGTSLLGKRVIELGCGLGLPGMAAAILGAKEVYLTDMAHAVPSIQANVDRNVKAGLFAAAASVSGSEMPPIPMVVAAPLEWESFASGTDSATATASGTTEGEGQPQPPFDIVLCSDLIYGEAASASLLAHTLRAMCDENTIVYFCYERRWAGDRGRSFFEYTDALGFVREPIPQAELHSGFVDDYIGMLVMKLKRKEV